MINNASSLHFFNPLPLYSPKFNSLNAMILRNVLKIFNVWLAAIFWSLSRCFEIVLHFFVVASVWEQCHTWVCAIMRTVMISKQPHPCFCFLPFSCLPFHNCQSNHLSSFLRQANNMVRWQCKSSLEWQNTQKRHQNPAKHCWLSSFDDPAFFDKGQWLSSSWTSMHHHLQTSYLKPHSTVIKFPFMLLGQGSILVVC